MRVLLEIISLIYSHDKTKTGDEIIQILINAVFRILSELPLCVLRDVSS